MPTTQGVSPVTPSPNQATPQPLSTEQIASIRQQNALQKQANTALAPNAAQFAAMNTAPTAEQFAALNRNTSTVGNDLIKSTAYGDRFGGNIVKDANGNNIGINGYGTAQPSAMSRPEGVNFDAAQGSFAGQPTGSANAAAPPLSMSGQAPQVVSPTGTTPPTGTGETPGTGTPPTNTGETPAAGASPTSGAAVPAPAIDQMKDYMHTMSGSLEEMVKQNQTMYQSILADMQKVSGAQIENITATSKAFMDNMTKQQDFYESERKANLAINEKESTFLQDASKQDYDNQNKLLQLQQNKSDNQYASAIDSAQENQSRYLGFLTGKFEAAGMADSSGGLQLIGKYLAAGQASLNSLQAERSDASQMFIARGNQLASDYFKQAFSIEINREKEVHKTNTETFERINELDNNKIMTEQTKNTQILGIMKENNNQKLAIRSQAFSEVQALANDKRQEAIFAHGVLEDAIRNEQWDKTFTETQTQNQRALDAQKTTQTGTIWENGVDTGRQTIGAEQWNKTFEQGTTEYSDAKTRAERQDQIKGLADLYSATKNPQYLDQIDELTLGNIQHAQDSSGYSINPIAPLNLNTSKFAPTIEADGSIRFNIKTGAAGGQCGRMVNDALGIPHFMTDTYEEKLAKAPIQVPSAGSAFVQYIKGSDNGHTGMVEKVYGDPNHPDGMDIVDSNFSNNSKDEKVRRAHIAITYNNNGEAVYTRNGAVQNITGFTLGEVKAHGGTNAYREQVRQHVGGLQGPSLPEPSVPQTTKPSEFIKSISGTQGLDKDQKSYLAKISDDIRGEPAYKDVYAVQSGYQNVKVGQKLDNAQGDLAIVNGMAKLLDPTGVVRPEEFKTVEEAQPVFARLGLKIPKLFSGDRLTGEARQQFKDAAEALYKEKLSTAQSTLKDKYYAQSQFYDIPKEAIDSLVNVVSIDTANASNDDARNEAIQYLKENGKATSEENIKYLLSQ